MSLNVANTTTQPFALCRLCLSRLEIRNREFEEVVFLHCFLFCFYVNERKSKEDENKKKISKMLVFKIEGSWEQTPAKN